MQLRDHPLIGFGGFSSWPPYWVDTTTPGGDKPRGEIGTLEKVTMRNDVQKVLFLWVDYNGSRYVGGMCVGDAAFCR